MGPRSQPSIFVLALVLLAGCTQTPRDSEEGLAFRANDEFGNILTDPDGRTLYIFTNDEPGVSKCYDTCAANWPAYLANETPSAPSSIRGDVSLIQRTGGGKQVAFRDMPLYYWARDMSPGDAIGDGVNAVWFVVREPPTNSDMLDDEGPNEVTTEDVQYFQDVTGFLAVPRGGGASTGVVMIHEWWGLNDNIRDMARILASHGYSVLAVDLFHGNVADTQEEAQQQVASLDQDEANENMHAAAQLLHDRGAAGIASLGWCFGGGQSLQLALSGEELVATIIYYGFLVTDEDDLGVIDWPVLGIFGEKDQAIPVSEVRAFERSLNNLSIDNDIYIYPEVGHAFANPSGDAWAPDETYDAWRRTLDFLDEHTN